MAHRTHSSSRSKGMKAQFFMLSAFAIVSILFLLSQWVKPGYVVDTSSNALLEEPFIFNNIKDKAEEVVSISENCEALVYNMQEFENYLINYAAQKNLRLTFKWGFTSGGNLFSHSVSDCPANQLTNFYIGLVSTSFGIDASFSKSK